MDTSREGAAGREAPGRALPALSREESLFLDGALPPEASRRMEERVAADAGLRERLDAWRRVADLWRDDATRSAAGVDPERVLLRARATAGARESEALLGQAASARAARRYVRVAAALLALGVGGTAWLMVADPTAEARERALDTLERERLDLQGASELLELPVVRPSRGG